jgi:hypothetical protein
MEQPIPYWTYTDEEQARGVKEAQMHHGNVNLGTLLAELIMMFRGGTGYYADRSNKTLSPGEEDKVFVHEGSGVIHGFIAVFSSRFSDQLVVRIELDGLFQEWWEDRFYASMKLDPATIKNLLPLIGCHIHDETNNFYGFYMFIPQEFKEHCTVSLVNKSSSNQGCIYFGLWYAVKR